MKNITTVAFLLAASSTVAIAQTPVSNEPNTMLSATTAPPAGTMNFSGTVVSSTGERLVVRGDNGQEQTFILNGSTVGRRTYSAGDRVNGSYSAVAGTGNVASNLTFVSAAPRAATTQAEPETTNEQMPTLAPQPTPAPAPAVDAKPTPTGTAIAEDAGNDTLAPAADDSADVLPATASPMPLIALFGFLAAGGAGAVRRFRKS